MKILVLLQDEEINWMSLKKIQLGYLKSISMMKKSKLIFVKSGPEFFSFLDEVEAYQPDVVIFLDISLQNPTLMKLISSRTAKNPKFIFILYGGFIQSTHSAWKGQSRDFIGFDISFICASDAYREIQQKYFINKVALQTIPYPVNVSASQTSKKKSTAFHIIYAGRLELQKNWLILLDIFANLTEINGKNLFLHMAGPVDYASLRDLNSEGYFQCQIEKFKVLYPHIKWHGHLSEKKLTNLMLKMDASISLSTFAFEDFGMVIPESLILGLPTIATDWGGYKDFNRIFPGMTIGIPVRKNAKGTFIESSKVIAAIKKIDEGVCKANTKIVRQYFNPTRIAKLFEKLIYLKTPFRGMTDQVPEYNKKNGSVGLQ